MALLARRDCSKVCNKYLILLTFFFFEKMLDLIHFSLPLRLSGSIQISYVSLFLNFTAVKKYNCNDHGDTMEGWDTEWRDIRTGTGDLIKKMRKTLLGDSWLS